MDIAAGDEQACRRWHGDTPWTRSLSSGRGGYLKGEKKWLRFAVAEFEETRKRASEASLSREGDSGELRLLDCWS